MKSKEDQTEEAQVCWPQIVKSKKKHDGQHLLEDEEENEKFPFEQQQRLEKSHNL